MQFVRRAGLFVPRQIKTDFNTHKSVQTRKRQQSDSLEQLFRSSNVVSVECLQSVPSSQQYDGSSEFHKRHHN